MFSSKEKSMAKPHENTGVVNLIGVGTTIVGEITSQAIFALTARFQAQ